MTQTAEFKLLFAVATTICVLHVTAIYGFNAILPVYAMNVSNRPSLRYRISGGDGLLVGSVSIFPILTKTAYKSLLFSLSDRAC